jgi:paraquat-inducible protein A
MGRQTCGRCGQRLSSRDSGSLQRVWAWWIAGVVAYIPANTLPMLESRLLFESHSSTIVGGTVELFLEGSWFVAGIVIFASVGIPVAKFGAIAWLAIAVRSAGAGQSRRQHHRRQQLYEVVEFIGRWSMIDVFVVAITSALVQLNVLVYVDPGPAAIAFALSVIFTMLSARAFDPRLIWDRAPGAPT